MKLNEIFDSLNSQPDEEDDNYHNFTSANQFSAYISRHFPDGIVPDDVQHEMSDYNLISIESLKKINNPTIALQKHVLSYDNPYVWIELQKIDKEILNTMLTNYVVIHKEFDGYKWFLNNYFKNNELLVNKWIRYAEAIRSQIRTKYK